MSFNPVPNKQMQGVYFSRKSKKDDSRSLKFNFSCWLLLLKENHGFIVGEKLNFDEHIQFKISKCNNLICIIKRLSTTFPRVALLTVYKSFTMATLRLCRYYI